MALDVSGSRLFHVWRCPHNKKSSTTFLAFYDRGHQGTFIAKTFSNVVHYHCELHSFSCSKCFSKYVAAQLAIKSLLFWLTLPFFSSSKTSWEANQDSFRQHHDHVSLADTLMVYSEQTNHCPWILKLCQRVELQEVESGEFMGTI